MFNTSQEYVDDVVNKPLAGELQVISLIELCLEERMSQMMDLNIHEVKTPSLVQSLQADSVLHIDGRLPNKGN